MCHDEQRVEVIFHGGRVYSWQGAELENQSADSIKSSRYLAAVALGRQAFGMHVSNSEQPLQRGFHSVRGVIPVRTISCYRAEV